MCWNVLNFCFAFSVLRFLMLSFLFLLCVSVFCFKFSCVEFSCIEFSVLTVVPRPGFPSHTKTGQSYSAIILTVWFQADHTLDHKGLWFQADHTLDMYGPVYDQPGTINFYGPEYGQSGVIKRKLGYCSQLTRTLMKLQDIPQPKVQYNHQIENKVAIIIFGHLLLNYW